MSALEKYEEVDLESLAIESLAEIENLEKELGFVPLREAFDNSTLSESEILRSPVSNLVYKRVNVEHSFELADSESERECLQDKYDSLRNRNEELEQLLVEKDAQYDAILKAHDVALVEIEDLKRTIKQLKSERDEAIGQRFIMQQQSVLDSSIISDSAIEKILREELIKQRKKFDELEFKFAEARSALARAQQCMEDHVMSRELAETERNQDRAARLLAERERDAYMAAYEASVRHLDKSKGSLGVRKPHQPQPATVLKTK